MILPLNWKYTEYFLWFRMKQKIMIKHECTNMFICKTAHKTCPSYRTHTYLDLYNFEGGLWEGWARISRRLPLPGFSKNGSDMESILDLIIFNFFGIMYVILTPISESWKKNPKTGNWASVISGKKIQWKFQKSGFGNWASVISGKKIQCFFMSTVSWFLKSLFFFGNWASVIFGKKIHEL